MLLDTGLTTDSRYAYTGSIRIYLDGERVNLGRVQPWNTADNIYVPIRPFFESLGAAVALDEATGELTITIQGESTLLNRDRDYFILRGTMVTTFDEIVRLFPYILEWFPELSLIVLHIPPDLRIFEHA